MIQEEVKNEMIKAMKEKRIDDKNTYSLFLSRLKNKAIEKRVDTLNDEDAVAEAKRFVKTMREEIEMNNKAGRYEVSDKISSQIKLIEKYIPTQLDEQEIVRLVESLNLPAGSGMKGIMAWFKENYQGRVDMGLVSKIARERL